MSNRTYRYFSGKPLFAFGHGLSYTKFDFKSGKLASKKIAADGTAKVTFTREERRQTATAMRWRRFISATSTPAFPNRNSRCAVLPACS